MASQVLCPKMLWQDFHRRCRPLTVVCRRECLPECLSHRASHRILPWEMRAECQRWLRVITQGQSIRCRLKAVCQTRCPRLTNHRACRQVQVLAQRLHRFIRVLHLTDQAVLPGRQATIFQIQRRVERGCRQQTFPIRPTDFRAVSRTPCIAKRL